jgi:Probable cobalt transporter subunit (CbtA)
MERKLLLWGGLTGALGGVLAFAFAWIFVEPQIQAAIDYESGRDEAQAALDKAAGVVAEPEAAEVFSRAIQGNLGIGVGVILFGIAMGLLVAVVHTVCLGRVGNLRPRTLALLVAGGSLLALYLVPFVKYPANPPAIGHGDTIGYRSALYLVMVVASIFLLAGAVWLGRRLAPRLGNWTSTLLAGAAFVVAIGIVMAVLPSFGELPINVARFGEHATETPLPLTDPSGAIVYPGFPADLLYNFRLYSIGTQLILFTTIGLTLGTVAERLLRNHRDSPVPEDADAP